MSKHGRSAIHVQTLAVKLTNWLDDAVKLYEGWQSQVVRL